MIIEEAVDTISEIILQYDPSRLFPIFLGRTASPKEQPRLTELLIKLVKKQSTYLSSEANMKAILAYIGRFSCETGQLVKACADKDQAVYSRIQ